MTLRRLREQRDLAKAKPARSEPQETDELDVFLCHAREDKPTVAEPLAAALKARGLRVWLDGAEILVGDVLTQKIDYGLAHARFGAVVISQAVFARETTWVRRELDALATREAEEGRVVVLPIWHGVMKDEVSHYSPTLASKLALETAKMSIDAIADEIAWRCQRDTKGAPQASPTPPEKIATADTRDPLAVARTAQEQIYGRPSIETLGQDVDRLRGARHSEEAAALAAITEHPTQEIVASGLRLGEARGVLSSAFRARASADLGGMRLSCQLLHMVPRGAPNRPVLFLTPWFPDARRSERAEWLDGEDVATVMDRIVARLELARLDASRAAFDPALFLSKLRNGLEVALGSLRDEPRMRGRLIEVVNDRWVLTDEGLESRSDAAFISRDTFPTAPGAIDQAPGGFTAPAAPSDEDGSDWPTLMEIARRTYLLLGVRSRRPLIFPSR